MSDRKLLMPKATAVWLVENTSLSFEQIAELCGLHVLEVKGIADGDVAQGIKGSTRSRTASSRARRSRTARRTWLWRSSWQRQDRDPGRQEARRARATRRCRGGRTIPTRSLWLMSNHPELNDSQIMRLVGTTKPTIAAIRERTHWNSPNIKPQHPVTLGLCTQIDLDNEVQKAARRLERERKESGKPLEKAGTLLPTSQTIPGMGPQPEVDIILPKPAEEESPRRLRRRRRRACSPGFARWAGHQTDDEPQ